MFKRLIITFLNIFFPPLAVLLLVGHPNEDVLLNCALFLLAVIPSHIHGFYISWTYFNRKRKVRKGRYPGKPKRGVWSDRINTGGAGKREAEKLKTMDKQEKRVSGVLGDAEVVVDEKEEKRRMRRQKRQSVDKVEGWDDGYVAVYGVDSDLSRASTLASGRENGDRRSWNVRNSDGYEIGRQTSRRRSRGGRYF